MGAAGAVVPPAVAPLAPLLAAPEPARWLNSALLELTDLRGKVVLLDFWTFGCRRCYQSVPWLTSLEARFEPARFGIVGVHPPEFAREKVKSSVGAKLEEFGITHPVVMDNDMTVWRAFENRY